MLCLHYDDFGTERYRVIKKAFQLNDESYVTTFTCYKSELLE
ncbi:hypothetical protein THF5H11_40298 [Vibrio jasicida]|nr:hypothetical protein THF5H11_40298 [Vibrio jasicida]CAH1607975.1 hypothetical protein THF5G08_50188 [Vibrio jasicida]